MQAALFSMSAEELVQALESAKLERRYEEALRQAERIYEEERARALRVQLLLTEDEQDELRDQMNEDEDEMRKLEKTNDELHDQLTAVKVDFQSAQMELKSLIRDNERCKAEINALNAANTDSAKLLSEKLALSRELASLKPELEHLRSQATTQQNILAEKLSLERELSTAQIELETEKRTIQRMKTQGKTAGHGESVMLDEIEDLKKELNKEKRNAQKQEREHMKKATEWDSQKEVMEGKLDAFRTKLRTTKEQLKDAQDELEQAQTAKFAQAAEATKARMNGSVNPRKRNVARFDPDMTIGTPGNGGAAKKQRASFMPGDKSTFSITPFLNKTMSILPESPAQEQVEEVGSVGGLARANKDGDNDMEQPNEEIASSKPIARKAAPKKSAVGKIKTKITTEPLKESTNPKANKTVKKTMLSKVTEEEAEDEVDSIVPVATAKPKPAITTEPAAEATMQNENSSIGAAGEMRKKKLLVNRPTIFDDEEDAAPKRTTKKLNLGGFRAGGSSLSFGKVGLAGKNKVLNEFSPLKKDRRVIV